MTRWFQAISACGFLLMANMSPVLADPKCKPVVGHFEAVVVPPGQGHCLSNPPAFCTAGRVWGGIQGNYQFIMTGELSSFSVDNSVPSSVPTTIQFFVGTSTILLNKGKKDGKQLFGVDTGSIDVGGQGGFASLITFTGGTDDMSGATGQIRLRGEFDAQEGATNGDYIGTLCTP